MKKKALGSTTARGYGWQHQKARREALVLFVPGQLCARCHKPMTSKRDHDDRDRTKYIGLSHGACNRKYGGQKGARNQAQQPGEPPRLEEPTSPFGFHDTKGRWNVTPQLVPWVGVRNPYAQTAT